MATDDDMFQVAMIAALEELRAERGVSYRKLSERTGINTGTLSKWLKGGTSMRIQVAYDLAAGIGVDFLEVAKRAQERMK